MAADLRVNFFQFENRPDFEFMPHPGPVMVEKPVSQLTPEQSRALGGGYETTVKITGETGKANTIIPDGPILQFSADYDNKEAVAAITTFWQRAAEEDATLPQPFKAAEARHAFQAGAAVFSSLEELQAAKQYLKSRPDVEFREGWYVFKHATQEERLRFRMKLQYR